MSDIRDMIQGTIQKTDQVVELFYQQKNQEAYGQMETLLTDMMGTIDAIFAYKAENDAFSFDEQGLTEVLKTTLAAMEDQDAILMADILKYDVIEKLQEIGDKL